MEVCRGSTCKCSSDLRLGVKSQSNPEIAGSYRSWPQSSLDRDSYEGRATDWRFRARKGSVSCPTPNIVTSLKLRDGDSGVNLDSERGTTQTKVKVPK